MNLARGQDTIVADYINTGFWSTRAFNEAKLFTTSASLAADAAHTGFKSIPSVTDWKLLPDARTRIEFQLCLQSGSNNR